MISFIKSIFGLTPAAAAAAANDGGATAVVVPQSSEANSSSSQSQTTAAGGSDTPSKTIDRSNFAPIGKSALARLDSSKEKFLEALKNTQFVDKKESLEFKLLNYEEHLVDLAWPQFKAFVGKDSNRCLWSF